jgi:hypothetical protein
LGEKSLGESEEKLERRSEDLLGFDEFLKQLMKQRRQTRHERQSREVKKQAVKLMKPWQQYS